MTTAVDTLSAMTAMRDALRPFDDVRIDESPAAQSAGFVATCTVKPETEFNVRNITMVAEGAMGRHRMVLSSFRIDIPPTSGDNPRRVALVFECGAPGNQVAMPAHAPPVRPLDIAAPQGLPASLHAHSFAKYLRDKAAFVVPADAAAANTVTSEWLDVLSGSGMKLVLRGVPALHVLNERQPTHLSYLLRTTEALNLWVRCQTSAGHSVILIASPQ